MSLREQREKQKGAKRRHIDELKVSGEAKQWNLNQSAVMCCPKYGEVYISIDSEARLDQTTHLSKVCCPS